MIVKYCEDGGWENWALEGQNWDRWEQVVTFHPHWDERTMGSAYEVRERRNFPGSEV
jgi:hypothetical protein